MLRAPAVWFVISTACATLGAGSVACGGSAHKGNTTPGPVARASTPLLRKACGEGKDRLLDLDGDGYANVREVSKDGHKACSEIDLNLDGRVDITRRFADDGRVSSEVHDLDFDGKL